MTPWVGDARRDNENFVAAAEDALGPIETLVSGAGNVEAALIHEQVPETFARQVEVHLVGAQRLVAELVPSMTQRPPPIVDSSGSVASDYELAGRAGAPRDGMRPGFDGWSRLPWAGARVVVTEAR